MDIDNLVRMANRIGDFFSSMPDQDEALDGIALHLRNYWEPRMRSQLLAHADQSASDSELSSLVRLALEKKRTFIAPQSR